MPEPDTLPFLALPARKRRPVLGAVMILAACAIPILMLLSLAALVFFLLLPEMFSGDRFGPCLWCTVVAIGYALVVGGGTRMASRTLFTNGRGHVQVDALTLLRKDKRPPVLYLRSFDDDGVPDLNGWKVQLGTTLTVEMSLAKALYGIGPLVSIGRPGEKLPMLGTNRFYVADEDWMLAVEHFLDIAQAVVIVIGLSSGVRWEIEAALARREKVVFMFPFIMPEARRSWWRLAWEALRAGKHDSLSTGLMADLERERHARYAEFRTMIEEKCVVELPQDLRGSIAIDFSDAQTPRVLKTVQPVAMPRTRDEQGVTVDYARTLRPFIDRLQGRMTKPDAIERAYANPRLLTRLAWLFAAVTVLALVSIPIVIVSGQSLGFIAVAAVVVLLGSNLAVWTYMLVRRNRSRERRERD